MVIDFNSMVSKNQGIGNAGKVMVVNDKGFVVPMWSFRPHYETLSDIAAEIRRGTVQSNAALFPVGDSIVMPWKDMDDPAHDTDETAYQVQWDIVHHGNVELQNGNTVPGMYMQMHRCTPYGIPLGEKEAFFVNTGGTMIAGQYRMGFGVRYNDTYPANSYALLTIHNPLPTGGRFRLNGNSVEVWNDENTLAETVPLSASAAGATFALINSENTASNNVNAMNRILYGSGRYATGNARKYLNANGTGWDIWKSDFDIRSNNYSKHGFLSGFSDDFLSSIKRVKVTTEKPTAMGAGTEDTYDYFFIPSLEQMNINPEVSGSEGAAFRYWQEALGSTSFVSRGGVIYDAFKKAAINDEYTHNIRLRSAVRTIVFGTYCLGSTGDVQTAYAYQNMQYCPVCVVC